MSYTQVFGGTTIYPSDVSYLAITLSADKALEWPLESNDPSNPASRIIDVTTSGSYSIVLPDATLTGAGQTILFNNLPASTNSFLVKDYAGNTIATVGIGEQWQVYLAATTTAAGTWRVFRYGASTATVQASALAGYGLAVTSNTLSQSLPVTTFNSSPRTALVTDRASALVWTGAGAGTLNLPSTVDAGNNFFIAVRNNGGGDLTVDAAGSETIDGTATLVLRPGDSAQLITDGLEWFTLGLGQEAVFAFDYTSISVTGGTYTLAGSELNRIAYEFVGNLASDLYVVVPSTIQQYWVSNATTGAYAMYLQTSGGTPIAVTQGARGIYYCNGSNVVDADTSTVPLPISAANGGTGITSYSIGDILYANSATTLTKLSDVATGNVLLSGGITTAPFYGKVGLATHVSGTLPVSNGGTGATTLTGYVKGSGTSALTASATVPTSDISGGAALTRVDDTNVTLTLGGTPSTALLAATSLTLGWSGTLAVSRGGTGTGTTPTNGQILIGNGTNYSLATISAGAGITITNGAGTISIAATGTGLTNWTEGVNTSAPNATVPAVYFNATNAATNVDAVIAPKGSGALLAATPDNAATGGDKRGTYAVDLQLGRAAATQVASGSSSVIAGGVSNTASGSQSGVLSGTANSATGGNAVVIGGGSSTASGSYALAHGFTVTADGIYSFATGNRSTARGLYGARAHSNGRFAADGDAQRVTYTGRISTTNNTVTELTLDGGAGSSTTRIVLPNDSTYVFDILVVARRTDADNESAGYQFTGVIDRNANAASTAIVGTVTKTVIAEDTAAWDVTVDADTTNGSLRIQVTGENAKTIRWVAVVNTVEVVG